MNTWMRIPETQKENDAIHISVLVLTKLHWIDNGGGIQDRSDIEIFLSKSSIFQCRSAALKERKRRKNKFERGSARKEKGKWNPSRSFSAFALIPSDALHWLSIHRYASIGDSSVVVFAVSLLSPFSSSVSTQREESKSIHPSTNKRKKKKKKRRRMNVRNNTQEQLLRQSRSMGKLLCRMESLRKPK